MLSPHELKAAHKAVRDALKEDLGAGDITTEALVPRGAKAKGSLIFREAGVVAGLPVAQLVFRKVAAHIVFRYVKGDGDSAAAGEEVATVFGPAAKILAAERVALNFLARMSGIATLTREFVRRAGRMQVLDTRKTTPGLRALEKYAVRMGGGANHRLSLDAAFFIKDNHIAAAGGLQNALEKAAEGAIVEADSPDAAETIARCPRAGRVLLDNMTPDQIRESVRRVRAVRPDLTIEASGGVTLATIDSLASTGVDAVSVGALTHSARALDVTLTLQAIS